MTPISPAIEIGFRCIRACSHIARIVPLVALALLIAVGFATPVAAAGENEHTSAVVGVVRDDATNLRSGPGRDYEQVARLDAGQQLQLFGRYQDWVQVAVAKVGKGWVQRDLLRLKTGQFDKLPVIKKAGNLIKAEKWLWPTRGSISSPFGRRTEPFKSFHNGIDIANRAGTPIRAVRSGTVIEAGWCSGFGYCVKVQHDQGFISVYGHLLRMPTVKRGEEVQAGQKIGLMGMSFDRKGGGYVTGVHLHFTLKLNGTVVNPLKYLP